MIDSQDVSRIFDVPVAVISGRDFAQYGGKRWALYRRGGRGRTTWRSAWLRMGVVSVSIEQGRFPQALVRVGPVLFKYARF